ncbi:hypothetical protein XENOCAPTIV_011293, partial [Xenoophorus captivus]
LSGNRTSFLTNRPLSLLQNAIMIHEVYEEGAAARDGRLCSMCVQVNGVNLRGASHEEAIASLRQTPAKVHLTVLRDESHYRDEENLDVFKVELQKKSGRGLGFSIVGKRSNFLFCHSFNQVCPTYCPDLSKRDRNPTRGSAWFQHNLKYIQDL